MQTIWIEDQKLENILKRHEAFWRGELDQGPLMWVTAADAKEGLPMPVEPDDEQQMWTDIDYLMEATESGLSRTHYAGDSLPVFNPWLGPDQVAAWLGAEIILKPKEFTSWVKPFVDDWDKFPILEIAKNNKWWQLYIDTVKASVEAGKDKWVTAYPDLHTGIDGLGAIRGPENLMMDMVTIPEIIKDRMGQMTKLFKDVIDQVSDIVLPGGQGTSNWTMGWSSKRFVCVGQNDFSCMISPDMFMDFCCQDTVETAGHVDYCIYHLDGPDAARHLPKILEIEKINCVQWIQGAGNRYPSKWLDMLKKIQGAGKSVQLCYLPGHGDDADFFEEVEVLCNCLDVSKLFFWFITDSAENADALVKHAEEVCSKKRI